MVDADFRMELDLFSAASLFLMTVAAVALVYGVFIAIYLLRGWFKEQRRSRTFDLILNFDTTRPDVFYRFGVEVRPSTLLTLVQNGEIDTKEYSEILSYLAQCEAISIGIREGFYDEQVLREFMGHLLIRTYRDTQFLIESLRVHSGNQKVYINTEAIARRWEEAIGQPNVAQ